NRKFEVWMHAKQDKLLTCLNVGVFIENPRFDPNKRGPGNAPPFLYTTFGPSGKKEPGFVASRIFSRKLNWVDKEEFIPYLARRIPDPNIEAAVKDKRVFNKFRGYPIEETPLKEGRSFLGSAWHKHLVTDICHGDETEWKHL